MIEIIKDKVSKIDSEESKLLVAREMLQIIILKIIRDKGYFNNLAFIGGTALRIVHRINRYSEDLDFSLYEKNNYNFSGLLEDLKKGLGLLNFDVNINYKENVVNSAHLKFSNLLQELSFRVHHQAKLMIKFEVDTNPPEGMITEINQVNDFISYDLKTFDKPSLMAGKLHAVLQRRYDKGRDYYDLLWYLLGGVEPNLVLLNNALKQTTGKDYKLDSASWKALLLEKLRGNNFKKIQDDVEPFLMFKSEARNLTLEGFERALIQGYNK